MYTASSNAKLRLLPCRERFYYTILSDFVKSYSSTWISTSTLGTSRPGSSGFSENKMFCTTARGSHCSMASRTPAIISTFATGAGR